MGKEYSYIPYPFFYEQIWRINLMDNTLFNEGSWAGAGLLGLVLSWLFFRHLPSKDKQIQDLIDSHNKNMQVLVQANLSTADKIKEEHREMLNDILSHCQSENKGLSSLMEKELESLSCAITALTTVVGKMDDHLRYIETGKRTRPV